MQLIELRLSGATRSSPKRTERVEEVGPGPQALIQDRNDEEMCVAMLGMVAATQLDPVLVEAGPPIF
jgi:hypothetical protein